MNQFVVSVNSTRRDVSPIYQSSIARMNETSLQFTTTCTIPRYGTLAYDALNQVFFVQSNLGDSLYLYAYNGGLLGNFSVGRQLQQIHYYSYGNSLTCNVSPNRNPILPKWL
jgi:hypothetical protein